jgi:AraC-like DNA-binding protein
MKAKIMKAIDDPKNWLPLKEVAHLLRVSRYTVARLCKELNPVTRRSYLRGWRATPGTLLISRESLEQYCTATQRDIEYWAELKEAELRDSSRRLKKRPRTGGRC